MEDDRAKQGQFPVQAHPTQPFNSMNFDEFLVKNMIAIHGHGGTQMVPDPSSSPAFFFENLANVNKKHDEASLEDFLVRTGLINMGDHHPQPVIAPVCQHQPNHLQLQMGVQHQQQGITEAVDSSSVAVYENPVVDVGYPENHLAGVTMVPTMTTTTTTTTSDCARKRRYSNMMEKSIERRQKRMIKNRESAARSRARKQAYTHQLEQEVDQLKKMNSWLKKQKELEMMVFSDSSDEPKYQLRRTSSALF
ncbi:hypothetical protein SLA2020_306950 [Shorea laevis]